MQAIRTVYFGPSSVKESRIKATCAAKSITVSLDPRLNLDDNHRKAAESLIANLGWDADGYGTLASGTLADGTYVHVLTGRDGKGG